MAVVVEAKKKNNDDENGLWENAHRDSGCLSRNDLFTCAEESCRWCLCPFVQKDIRLPYCPWFCPLIVFLILFSRTRCCSLPHLAFQASSSHSQIIFFLLFTSYNAQVFKNGTILLLLVLSCIEAVLATVAQFKKKKGARLSMLIWGKIPLTIYRMYA